MKLSTVVLYLTSCQMERPSLGYSVLYFRQGIYTLINNFSTQSPVLLVSERSLPVCFFLNHTPSPPVQWLDQTVAPFVAC